MPIIYNEKTREFHLYNQEISYIIKILDNDQPGQLYYGKRLTHREDFSHLFEYAMRDMSPYAFEGNSTFSLENIKQEYPTFGCGDMRFLFHIILPMSKPTISSMAVYLFVQIYNQFFWPLLVTNTEKMRTIQIGISMLVTGDVVNYGHILAGAVIAIIPAMMIYIIGQDYMIRGMTSGGVKG